MKSEFQYIEDNGGGLHLFVFRHGKVVAGITNLEYARPGEWADVKDELSKDAFQAIRTWEGHMQDVLGTPAEEVYEGMGDTGWAIVADEKGVYPDRMGRAAQIYFGVAAD